MSDELKWPPTPPAGRLSAGGSVLSLDPSAATPDAILQVDHAGTSIIGRGENYWERMPDAQPTGMATAALARWKFTGALSAVTDLTGNGYDLAWSAAPATCLARKIGPLTGSLITYAATFLRNAVGAGLKLQGAMTVEAVAEVTNVHIASVLVALGATGDTEAENTQWLFGATNYKAPYYLSEHDAGTDDAVTCPDHFPDGIAYLAWTRSAAGVVTPYWNSQALTPSSAITMPTGGTGTLNLRVGLSPINGGEGWRGAVFDIRITAAEFSAAQIAEVYEKVRGRY